MTQANDKKKQKQVDENLHQPASEDLVTELAAAREQALRAQADYQNLLKRTQHEQQQRLVEAKRAALAAFIDPIENLQRAAAQLNNEGLNLVTDMFASALQNLGVEVISPKGQKFDVRTMEAVQKFGEGDTVLEVISSGYKWGEHVLRHAQVVVGSH